MFEAIRQWYKRTFTNPQVVILGFALLLGLLCIILLGKILAPVFAAVIIAYLMEGLIGKIERTGTPRILAVSLVFALFLATLFALLFGLLPFLIQQVSKLLDQVPGLLEKLPVYLEKMSERYPALLSEEGLTTAAETISAQLSSYGKNLLDWTLSSILGIFSLIIFLILIPFLVFFFLKDKHALVNWVTSYLPQDRELVKSVWIDVDRQMGNYVRGKTLEIFIVGAVTWATFKFLGLNYAILLATVTGFSVLIPFIGAALVTVPIFVVALVQFGWGSELIWVMVAYGIIQALDGNVLVPIMFSEVNNLHPVAIIIAVLFFGGIWGFWGVFFAIPLATVVGAVLRAWPRNRAIEAPES